MTCWLVSLFTCALCLGCNSPPPPPIEVGHVADLGTYTGNQAKRGISLALEDVNKDAKRRIVVPHADSQGKIDAFETQAVRLVAVNNARALIGGNTAEELAALDRG